MSVRALAEELEREGWPLLKRWIDEGERESQHLEVKVAQMDGGPGKLSDKTAADIAKAVSGLANAEGGVIIVGLAAEKPVDGSDDQIHRIVPVEAIGAFARVVQERLPKLVEPEVPGVRAWPITDPEDDGRGVLAIYVPTTDAGPFRTGRGLFCAKNSTKDVSERYYLRNGPNTSVMSHTMLGLMFGRRPAPSLQLLVDVVWNNPLILTMTVSVRNIGRGAARDAAVHVECHGVWKPRGHGTDASWRMQQLANTEGAIYQAPVGVVVYPGQMLLVGSFHGNFREDGSPPQTLKLNGVLYADAMGPHRFSGTFPLVRGQNVTLPPLPMEDVADG